MEKITQEFLDEFKVVKEKYEDMLFQIMEQIAENDRLEGLYIDKTHPIYEGEVFRVEINDKFEVDTHYWDVRNEEYAEGGYSYPLNKLLNDDWKPIAIAKYQKEQEELRIKKEQQEREENLALEEKERAEYERLRAKYGD